MTLFLSWLLRRNPHCRKWTKVTIRRIAILSCSLLFLCGALFSIGQLQACHAMPPVKPFHHEDNRTGILLIHGFGGSPVEVQPLAETVPADGYTVAAPLLPGHGTTPRDFDATTNEPYLAAVREEFGRLKPRCDCLSVVGFSMGGLIALQPENKIKPDGHVLMSTPIQPWHDLARFVLLKAMAEGGIRIQLDVPTLGLPTLVKATKREPGYSTTGLTEPRYAAYSATSRREVLEMIETVKPQLSSVRTPALILQSRDDHVGAPSSASYLYQHLGAEQKRLVCLENSGHGIALGNERNEVKELVSEFAGSGVPP